MKRGSTPTQASGGVVEGERSPLQVWVRASGPPIPFKGPEWEVQGVPIPFPMDGVRPGARDPYPLRP